MVSDSLTFTKPRRPNAKSRLTILRRRAVRIRKEIERERYAFRLLRCFRWLSFA